MLCVSHDNTIQERGQYMTESLNHHLSVVGLSLRDTQATMGQDLGFTAAWSVEY